MTKNTEPLSFFGAITTFLSGLTLNDFTSICGLLFGLATLVLHWYYKQKEYELRKLEIEKRAKK